MSNYAENQPFDETYRETLVFTESRDGLPLEGIVIAPAPGGAVALPNDRTVVWIHGGASKFYERHYILIGRALAARGVTFVAGNTRGHDAFTVVFRGDDVIPAGASFERFDESPHDVGAWIDFAMTLGVDGVVLVGHSLGASKVTYYQAIEDDPRVRGIVAAGPPMPVQSPPERVALAERMVAEGQGEELLPHLEGTPRWNIVSAQMVASRAQVIQHAFDSNTAEPHIAKVRCPILVLYGTDEDVDGDWLATLRRNAHSAPSINIRMIAGAGHEYTGHEQQVADDIATWSATLP